MVIYLEQFRATKAPSAALPKNGTYGDEIMQASWNPDVIHMERKTLHAAPSPALPEDLTSAEADAFLGRIYGLATLI